MGLFLRRRFGNRLVSIGNIVGGGTVECAGVACCEGFRQTLEPASADSIAGLAGKAGSPQFLLDLRTAPAPVVQWLRRDQPLGHGEDAFDVPVGRAFDVLWYLNTVTPACH